jgi:hypothetical protein
MPRTETLIELVPGQRCAAHSVDTRHYNGLATAESLGLVEAVLRRGG